MACGIRETDPGAFFEAIAVGAMLLDPTTRRLRRVNARCAALLGYTGEELNRLTLTDLIPPSAREPAEKRFAQLAAGELTEFTLEQQLQRKDGTFVLVILTASLLRASAGAGEVVTALMQEESQALPHFAPEGTDRSEAEKALRKSEERLRRVVEIETVGIVFFSASGAITEANDAFLRMSGYDRRDLRDGRVRWDLMTPPESVPQTLRAMDELRASGRTVPYEKQYVRQDGSRWWARCFATRPADGERAEFVIDITESRASNEELRRHRDDLESTVKERTAALDATNAALRDEIVERHRTENARQELLLQLATAQEEERRRLSRELHDQIGQHLTALVLGLKSLESAALDATKQRTLHTLQIIAATVGKEMHDLALELRPTSLDDLGLLRALANHIEQWSLQSRVQADFHTSGWVGDRLPLAIETTAFRIVQEALSNVLKHAHANRVSVIVARRADQVTMIVEDDGAGFDVEASPPQPRRKPLGLLAMQERAALLDGEVKIESSPGHGTTVFVRIPIPMSAPIKSHG
jgi:PAS domain S-box-containing protein